MVLPGLNPGGWRAFRRAGAPRYHRFGMNTSTDPGLRLAQAAERVSQMRRAIAADDSLRAWTGALKQWQARRLAQTHADLLASPDTAAAARFFLDDLYGAKDFARRDAELIRLLPTMIRLLPARALATVAGAVELDALSEGLDEAIARRLQVAVADAITEAAYAQAYRASATRAEREHQLDLVLGIGQSLEGLVRHPMIGRLLRAMAVPARLAGLAEMQDFLGRGFSAFGGMPSTAHFLAQIDQRERSIMARIFEGCDEGWITGAKAG